MTDQKNPTPHTDGMDRLWGRHKAFKLRAHQAELLAKLMPRIEAHWPQEPGTLLDPASLFADAAPKTISLEIGFGGGEHLAEWAAANPQEGFIGVEPFINGLAKMLVHVEERGLENVLLSGGDARHLVEHLKPASLDRIFILHPDPWPKKRHNKRRYIQDETLEACARALKDGGTLRICSDIPSYIDWTMERLARRPELRWNAQCAADWLVRPDDWPATRYGQKAEREGRTTIYLDLTRLPRP